MFYEDVYGECETVPAGQSIRASKEADARAKMLIYLLEHDLLLVADAAVAALGQHEQPAGAPVPQ